jgi:hypothetical protein
MLNYRPVFAQYPDNPVPQYPESWNSRWITHPDIDKTAYNMVHFRKAFELDQLPENFIIHVSGDNRYRLYINGTEVCYGPQLGDMRHWRYESLDIAPFLSTGLNIIAAEVMNWGVERSYGIISFNTGFLLQGHTALELPVSTGRDGWKVFNNPGIFEKTVHWRGGGEIVGGFYASNPTDSVVAAQYPWGWNELNFDDSQWKQPETIFSQPKTNAGAGHGWILQPRTTAIQKNNKEDLGPVVRSDIQHMPQNFSFGAEPLEIPANSKATILIDQGKVTMGYPKLILSQGLDAVVQVKYSEDFYDENNNKGNRNEIAGKVIKGISDVYVMDGGSHRVFQPVWFRGFRFVQLQVQTANQPLIIEDFHNIYSASPIPVVASFNADDAVYQKVWEICQHGIEICAQDNLLSDLYYEQMQYVGDLRPHLMAWTALTGDLSYFRSAIEQFNNSRLPDGNVTSCYPLKATFVHPTYSLMWIDMLHDLMMLEGDKEFIAQFTGEIQEVFDYYQSLVNGQGMVGKSAYHMFIDWYENGDGNSAVNRNGNSAILTLNYAYTLGKASEILTWLGQRNTALIYKDQSRKYAEIVRKLCYDTQRGIYADDPEMTFYDQRASILAVLTDAHSESERKVLMEKVLDESVQYDSKANLFYYFYLFESMERTGVGNFTKQLQPWKEIVDMGMTATPEKRIEQHPRSEVHPWTAHPVHFYYSVVAGIRPDSPGFDTVNFNPNPGDLQHIEGSYPTIKGTIEFDLDFEDGAVHGSIQLPQDMTGGFHWLGKKTTLTSGSNEIVL